VSDCDCEASTLRKIWPTEGCLVTVGGGNILETNVKHGIFQITLTYSTQNNFTEIFIVVFVMGDSHFPMQRHTQLFVNERIINQKRNILCKYSELLLDF
jgi:hypothetical protein